MNSDIITLNECANDGTKIFVYPSVKSGQWESFGFSAFAVHSLCNMPCEEMFSEQLQMPALQINDSELKRLMTQSGLLSEKHQTYIRIHTDKTIDQTQYIVWATALREV